MINKIKIFILFILITTSSCIPAWKSARKHFSEDLRGASPDFKKGWEDGCETGSYGGSNSFYQLFLKSNKVDAWKLTSSPDYKSGWNYAFWYCYRADYIDQKSWVWGSIFGGHI